jgi:hypothetical protein
MLGDAGTQAAFNYGDTSVYAGALDAAAPGLSTVVAQEQGFGESWLSALERLLPTLVLADSQRRLLNVQMERAASGLPPLSTSQYGLGVNVGLSPQTLMIGGAVLLGAVLLLRKG